MIHLRWTGLAIAACLALGGLVSSCGLLPIPTTSDVPRLRPTAWADDSFPILLRLGQDGDQTLLLTSLTGDQFDADLEDMTGLGDGEHQAVYRLDRPNGDFEVVADEQWDELDSGVTTPASGSQSDPPFFPSGGRLQFEGRAVPVAGGTLLTLRQAPNHDVVAVLSTSGTAPIPFLSSAGADGQHYHRLYSEEDGSPLGPAVRLGVGGRDNGPVKMGWGPEDRYVVYWQSDGMGRGLDLLCVVFVGDEIDRIESEEP